MVRRARLRLLVRRHGGLWPLRPRIATTMRRSPRRQRLSPPRLIQKLRGTGRSWLRHFLGRAARGAVRPAPSRAGTRLALDAMVWTGEGSPTLDERRKKLPEFTQENRRRIEQGLHPLRVHPRPSGTADDKVIDAFADAVWRSTIPCRPAPMSTCARGCRW